MTITRENFYDYIRIQKSGVTNMCDIPTVCALSTSGLTKEKCLYIMEYYLHLIDVYGEEGKEN